MSGTTSQTKINPLVAQGTLNRLRGSVVVSSDATLNATAAFLGKEGINIALQGDATAYIGTMTGAVTSPEPYQLAAVEVHLLRTQTIASTYKARMETDSRIGDITVTPDSAVLPAYTFVNCSIANVRPLRVNGTDAGYVVTLMGVYYINNELWNLV